MRLSNNSCALGNIEKGMLLEKAVSQALWNNNIMHNHNPWDDRGNYVWGDSEDHYLIEHRHSIECKNYAEKTVQNISPAFVHLQILRGKPLGSLVITYEPKEKIKEQILSLGVEHIITVGFQVTPENYNETVWVLTQKFHNLFNRNSVNNSPSLYSENSDIDDLKINSNVGVCNSSFIISYFIDYLLVSYVIDSVVNVFYMIIDDKPKINDPPDKKNNVMNDVCVSETNNTSNVIYKKTNSNNKFYLTLNPNKIMSKLKNRMKKTKNGLINWSNKIATKLNPNRLFSERIPILSFASFG